MPATVKAEGWINHNSSIYGQEAPTESKEEKSKQPEAKYNDEFSDHETGKFEAFFGELFYAIGDFLHGALKKVGFDIDNIVLGRVAYGKKDVNLFGFELAPNNPYGVIAALVYRVLRSIVFLLIVVQLQAIVARSAFKNNPKEYLTAKNEITGTWLIFGALILMPFILDVVIYMRDVILYVIRGLLSNFMGNPGFELWDSLSEAYEASDHALVPGLLCCGAAALSLTFVYFYVLLAVTCALLFICFAIICAYGPRRRKRVMEEWGYMFIANLLVPIIDYVLIMLVALFPYVVGTYNLAVELIQLVCAWLIIKARGMVMRVLALNTGHENSGMSGLVGLLAAGRLMKSVASSVGGAVGNIKGAAGDFQSAKDEKNVEDIDKGPQEFDAGDESDKDNNVGTGDKDREGLSGSEEYADNDKEGEAENDTDTENQSDEFTDNEDGRNNEQGNDNPIDEQSVNEQQDGDNSEEEQLRDDNERLQSRNNEINDKIHDNNDKIRENKDEIAELDNQNSKFQDEINSGNLSPEQEDKLRSQIDANNQRKDDLRKDNNRLYSENGNLKNERSSNVNRIRDNNRQLSSANNGTYSNRYSNGQSDYGSNAFSDMTNRYNPATATPKEQKMHEIAKKRANVDNFDTPEFAGKLSHQEMADFYRKRAVRRIGKAAGGIAGGVSMGAIGMAAGSWLGPQAMMYGASGGVSAGSSVGSTVGSGMAAAGYGAASTINNYRNSFGGNNRPGTSGKYYGYGRARGCEPSMPNDLGTGRVVNIDKAREILRPQTEGEFMMDSNLHSNLERSNEAINSANFMSKLTPDKQDIALNGRMSYYKMALENGDVTREGLLEQIKTDALAGKETLSQEQQLNAEQWTEKLIEKAKITFNL